MILPNNLILIFLIIFLVIWNNIIYFVVRIKNMDTVIEKVDVRTQIADYLKDNGIKRSWLAKKISRSTTLISFILDCNAELLDENLDNINKALGTSFKKV